MTLVQSGDVLEKVLYSDQTLPSSVQYLGDRFLQHLMEINLVILQKLIDRMPQGMCALIKAKDGPTAVWIETSLCPYWHVMFIESARLAELKQIAGRFLVHSTEISAFTPARLSIYNL